MGNGGNPLVTGCDSLCPGGAALVEAYFEVGANVFLGDALASDLGVGLVVFIGVGPFIGDRLFGVGAGLGLFLLLLEVELAIVEICLNFPVVLQRF